MRSLRTAGVVAGLLLPVGWVACGSEFRAKDDPSGGGGSGATGGDAGDGATGPGGDGGTAGSSGSAQGGTAQGGTAQGGTAQGGGAQGGTAQGGTAQGGTDASGGKSTGGKAGADATGGRSGASGSGGLAGASGAGAFGGGLAGAGGSGGAAGAAGSNTGPLSDDGLVYWFSADVGLTESSRVVSRWTNRAGGGDATQISPGARPTLGTLNGTNLPAVVFDGDDDYLGLPPLAANIAGGLSFFAVARSTGEPACAAIVELSNGSEIDDVSFDWQEGLFQYEVDFNVATGQSGAFETGELRLVGVTHADNDAVNLWVNGLSTGLGDFAPPSNIDRNQTFIGRSLYQGCPTFIGEISEIIFYARTLGTTERQRVETYLQNKWNCCSL